MDYREIYKGVIVPMVTPLENDLTIDRVSVKKIIDSFISADVVPFILGTTGEAPSLSSNLRVTLVETTVDAVAGRSLIYAGISGNCLEDLIEEGKIFAEKGIDVVVATPPSYYPMNSQQMVIWFESLADALPKPLIIYNMPAMTKQNIPLEVVEALSRHGNIVGLKDSERDEIRLNSAIEMFRDRTDFVHLLGWAAMSATALTKGSAGIVPSTGNIAPKMYRDLYVAAKEGYSSNAMMLQELTNYLSAFYQNGRTLSESIPALKVMMWVRGLCKPDVAPPMYRMVAGVEEEYAKEMKMELSKTKYL